jgi:hypothetical protein
MITSPNMPRRFLLTGIERGKGRFRQVQVGLCDSKHVQAVSPGLALGRHEVLTCQRGASVFLLPTLRAKRALVAAARAGGRAGRAG